MNSRVLPPRGKDPLLFSRTLLSLALAWLPLSYLPAAPASRKQFDIPKGAAETTLRLFALQAEVELVFAVSNIENVTTHAVKGAFAPREVLEHMVAKTGLAVEEDTKSGALMLRRATAAPAAPPGKSPPPAAPAKKTSTTMQNKNLLTAIVGVFAFGAGGDLSAADAAAQKKTGDEIVSLNEFVVTAADERGYAAGNAISGTKTNTALKDLPYSITVITESVLRDINAVVPTDALQYVPGVTVTVQTNVNAQANPLNSDGQILVRGTGTFYNLRNGVRIYEQPAAISIQRVEVVRGPAAVLYGVTKPGGVANFITKVPTFGKNSGRITATYGSFDSYRFSLDANYGAKVDNFAFRLLGSFQSANTQYVASRGTERAIHPILAWKPFKNTLLSFEYEYAIRQRPRHIDSSLFFSRSIPGYPGSSVPFWVTSRDANDPVALIDIQRWLGPLPNDPVARAAAIAAARARIPANLSPEWTFRGRERIIRSPTETFTFGATQRFTDDLSVNMYVVHNWRENRGDDGLADTVEFADVTTAIPATEAPEIPRPRIRRQYNRFNSTSDIWNSNLTALYKLNFQAPVVGQVESKFMLGAQAMREDNLTYRLAEFIPGTNSRQSYYLPFAVGVNTGYPANWPRGEVRRLFDQETIKETRSDLGFASWSGELFDRRLILAAGVTRIDYSVKQRRPFDQVTPGVNFDLDVKGTSPILGIIARPLPWLGIFAQTSKSINSADRIDGWGRSVKPEHGRGIEGGFKIDPAGGRLSSTISVFSITEDDRIINDGVAPNQFSFPDPVDPNVKFTGPDDPRLVRWDELYRELPGQQRGAWRNVGQAKLKGVDLDLTYSFSRAFQFITGYSYLDGKVTKDLNRDLGTMNGRPLPNVFKHRVTFLGKYRWDEGVLKNWDVALGVRWRSPFISLYDADSRADIRPLLPDGRTNATALPTGNFEPRLRYSRPQWDGDFRLGYRRKVLGYYCDFAINAKNLFEAPNFTGSVPIPYDLANPPARLPVSDKAYYYKTPRTYEFTMGLNF